MVRVGQEERGGVGGGDDKFVVLAEGRPPPRLAAVTMRKHRWHAGDVRILVAADAIQLGPRQGSEARNGGSICRSSWTVMTYPAQPQNKLRKPI